MSEVMQKIKEIFIIMQDRFKNVEKRQPITLIDALAFTNMACDNVGAVVGEWQKQLQKHIDQLGERTVDVKVWVQETPPKKIKGMKGATKTSGRFVVKKAVLLEEILEGLRRHLK